MENVLGLHIDLHKLHDHICVAFKHEGLSASVAIVRSAKDLRISPQPKSDICTSRGASSHVTCAYNRLVKMQKCSEAITTKEQ